MNQNGFQIDKNQWVRKDNEYAIRVRERDLEGLFNKGLRIESGTRAMFFRDGAYIGELDPGYFDIKQAKARLPGLFGGSSQVAVILVDEGDTDWSVEYASLVSSDDRYIDVELSLVTRIIDPNLFFTNCMKSKYLMTLGEVMGRHQEEINDALGETIRKYGALELSSSRQLKEEIMIALVSHMNTSLKRDGLKLIQIRSLKCSIPGLDAISDDRRKSKAEWEKKLFELEKRIDSEKITDREHQVALDEMRNSILRTRADLDIRNEDELYKLEHDLSFALDKMDREIAVEDRGIPLKKRRLDQIGEWRKTLAAAEKDKALDTFDADKFSRQMKVENAKDLLFTQDELDDLQQGITLKSEDRKDKLRARLTLTRKLEVMENHEQKLLKLELEAKERVRSQEWIEQEKKAEFNRVSVEKNLIKQQIENSLMREEIEFQRSLQHQELEAQSIKIQKLEHDKEEFERKKMHVEADRLEAQLGMELLKQVKQTKLWEDTERQRLEQERLLAHQNLEIEKKKQELELRLIEQRAEFERLMGIRASDREDRKSSVDEEIRKMEALSKMSLEALLSQAPAAQAEVIRKLKRDDRFSMMSDEQIKASQLSDLPPHVAEMLKEQFKGASSREMIEMERRYAQMTVERKDRDLELAESRRKDEMDRLERLSLASQRSSVDLASALKNPTTPQTVIVPAGGGQPTVIGQGPSAAIGQEEKRHCTGCGRNINMAANFCPYCGHPQK